MEEEIAELRRQLAEEQRRREEEQRRREAAKADAEQSQPNNLVAFLKSCHGFSLALRVMTDKTLTTKGDTTKPASRPFPHRIVPWNDFVLHQERVWEKLALSALFTTQKVYPSTHQLEYVQKYLDPISSELGLQHFARDTVENPVRTLVQEIYKNVQLREHLQLGGSLMFESDTNLGKTSELPVEEGVEHISMSAPHASEGEPHRMEEQDKQASKKGKQGNTRRNRRITRSADQFCIYELVDGQKVPVVLVEYKAPHKLPLVEIITGLRGEIRPAEEIINKESDDVEFRAKSLLAVVITQLFASMIGKGVQWGYIFTGEAIIFLYIPDNPTTVQYYLSVPVLDFQDDDKNRFHRTSVAQITAFTLNALAAKAPGQSWHDIAVGLDTWAIEYIDILKNIPETDRKAPFHHLYKSGPWKGFSRSPIRTRARSVALAYNKKVDDQVDSSGDEDDDIQEPPTPTSKRAGRDVKPNSSASARRSGRRRGLKKSDTNEYDNKETISKPKIEDRPYCTHQCLLGLASDGPLDEYCPNLKDHQGQHLRLQNFLLLIRAQLATDRGPDAECRPLHVKGSRGALVKIRLSSHGYTLVAKAMKQIDRKHLLQEARVYRRLNSLQGSRIPVCLGILDLDLPFYYDYGIYVKMLLLSWAGHPLHQHLNRENEVRILDEVTKTLTALHAHQVLHKDVEPRNWVWQEERIMLVDFERAEIRARSPHRKRNHQGKPKYMVEGSEFDREMRNAKSCISRYTR